MKVFTDFKLAVADALAVIVEAEKVIERARFSDYVEQPHSEPATVEDVRAVIARLEEAKRAIDHACEQERRFLCEVLQFMEAGQGRAVLSTRP